MNRTKKEVTLSQLRAKLGDLGKMVADGPLTVVRSSSTTGLGRPIATISLTREVAPEPGALIRLRKRTKDGYDQVMQLWREQGAGQATKRLNELNRDFDQLAKLEAELAEEDNDD